MEQRIKAAGLLVAAVLVMAGCSGPDGGGAAPSPELESSPAESDPAKSSPAKSSPAESDAAKSDAAKPGTAAGTPEPGSGESKPAAPNPALDSVGAVQYTPDQLSAALAAANTQLGLGGVVHTDAQIRPQLEAGSEELDEIVITPQSCAVFIDTELEDTIGQTTFALLTVNEDITVTISSFADPAVLQEQARANEQALEACSTFQVQAGDAVFDAETEELPAESDAQATFAVATVATLDGETVPTVTMNGTSGSTKVEVTFTDPDEPEQAVGEGRTLIDAVLAHLAGYSA